MNVLSLFDGMSCGRVALERANIQVKAYYASEIDKYATQVSQNNYPDIIRLGDINNWESWDIDWSSIDLILAGSPCQGFSFAGKQLAFEDHRSKLYFVFEKILNHVKRFNPDIKFMLENVRMKKVNEEIITRRLFTKPIKINSALVSAQNRERLYWCNWEIEQPEDKRILLKDIVHEKTMVDRDKAYCIDANYAKGTTPEQYFTKSRRQIVFNLSPYMVPFDTSLQILDKEVIRGKIGFFRKDSQSSRVYSIHGKSVTLCGDAGGVAAKMGQYLFGFIAPDRVKKIKMDRDLMKVKSFTL